MYVMSIKTTDASCVITHSFEDFQTGSFEFHISGSIRHKKVHETGKCSIVESGTMIKFLPIDFLGLLHRIP